MAIDISNESIDATNTYGDSGPSDSQIRDSQDLAAFVRNRYDRGQQSIRQEQHDYWLNYAFLSGHQWLWYNPTNGNLDELPRDPERVRAVMNRMWANTRTIISNLVQRELTFEIRLKDADDAHRRGGKIAEAILLASHNHHDWEQKREIFAYAVWKGGTAAMCIEWDPTLGNVIANDVGAEGGTIQEGDTVETVLSISEFVVEPGARDAERALWWIKAQTLPPRDVQEMFDLDWTPRADATTGLSPFQHKLLTYDRGVSTTDEMVDLTMVFTYYERPNKLAPKGRIIQVVNDVVVNNDGKGEDWYFPWDDRLNLVIARETPRETRWTGDTVLTMARSIQTLYNVSWSSIIEHMKLAGNARLMIPESAIDMLDDLSDLPGEAVPYPMEGGMPSYLSPPQMPSWWIDEPRELAAEMDDIMGVHDISRGSAPANIESGYGISILAEKDATPIGRLSKELARAHGRIASMQLKLYEKFAKQKRRTSIESPDVPVVVLEWSGEDLMGQTEAYVPLDAVLPRSRASQMQMAKDMLGTGLITSLAEFAAIAELPGQHDILKVVAPDIHRAQTENAGFAVGRQSIPEPWDDHNAHIHEHNKFRKSMEYQLLDEEDQLMIQTHIDAHTTLAAEDLAKQRGMEQMDPALPELNNPNEAPMPALPPELAAPMDVGAVPGSGPAPLPPPPENPGTIDGATVASDIMAALTEPPV